MEITYTPNGQGIVFRGADDPLKLKGVKFTKGYCSVVWFEKLDQLEDVETVRSILNSLRRGGDRFWITYSYNPPKTMWSWVNVERLACLRRDDTLVRGSSYLDVIEGHPDWAGAPFIEEAEYLRDTNEKAWRWEYRGEITGTGGAVFDNVHDSKLTDGGAFAESSVSATTLTRDDSRIPCVSFAAGGSLQSVGFSSSRSTARTR